MDSKSTEVSERLQGLLQQLSVHHYSSNPAPKRRLPTISRTLRSSEPIHRRTLSKTCSREKIVPAPQTPPAGGRQSNMGIRGTDDYLTARAANPRTGLISPSVMTNLTPRTPLSPGEALWLYGDGYACPPPPSSRAKPPERSGSPNSRPRPGGPRGRWRQNSKGWVMETVTEIPSPKVNPANSSASRVNYNASEDSFIIPMPSAKDPQPYKQSGQTSAQVRAVGYYKDKAKWLSQQESTGGLNGRMHSVGAGPRKFAEATKALKRYNASPFFIKPDEDVLPELSQVTAGTQKRQSSSENPFTDCSSPKPLTAFPPFSQRSVSSGNIDSIDLAVNNMPGSFDKPDVSAASQDIKPSQISRKPVGSPSVQVERRDSDATVGTATSSEEKEVCVDGEITLEFLNRMRSNSNSTRFQDLRQLPRVRIIHPDSVEISSPEQAGYHGKRVFTLPESMSTPPPPYPHYSTVPTMPPYKSETPSVESLSPIETQVMGLLAWAITCFFRKPKSMQDTAQSNPRPGILQAIHTLSDADTRPWGKILAAKALALAAVRMVLVLGCLVAVIRIGAAVGKMLEVVFWPVGVVLVVLKWVLGYG